MTAVRAAGLHGGFTLLEMLAVLLLTSILIAFVLDAYVDLSNQSAHASEVTRDIRRATSVLDRIAHDLERTLLVTKPDEVDPLNHPWIFLADSRVFESGADRIKFIARRPGDRPGDSPASLETVAYSLRESAFGDEGYELVRWSAPDLPEGLDREFPRPDDPDAFLLADGVSHFALRFLAEDGEWADEWDSSQLLDSSELPLAVEIEVALEPLRTEPLGLEPATPIYRRQVLLPLRPLDLTVLLDEEAYASLGSGGAEAGGETEDGGLTVADCIDFSKLNQAGGGSGSAAGQLGEIGNLLAAPWGRYRQLYGDHPAVLPHCR